MSAPPKLQISEIADADVADVIAVWQLCDLIRPWNNPLADIAFARRQDHSTLLVGKDSGVLVASVMVGHDGHQGAVYYVSIDPDCRGRGFGRAIMEAAESWLVERGVWKLNLMVRAENTPVIEFYNSIGY